MNPTNPLTFRTNLVYTSGKRRPTRPIGEKMNPNTARRVAWSLVVVYVVLATVGLAMQVVTKTSYTDIAFPVLIPMVVLAGAWPVIGALIVARHPEHPVGWLLCVGSISASIDMFAAGYLSYDTYVYAGSLPGVPLALIWLKWGSLPFATTAFTLMILVFPDGHAPSPGWRKVAWTAVGALMLYLPLQALEPGPVDPFFLPFLMGSIRGCRGLYRRA